MLDARDKQATVAFVAEYSLKQRNVLRGLLALITSNTVTEDLAALKVTYGAALVDEVSDDCEELRRMAFAHFNDELAPLLIVELEKFQEQDSQLSTKARVMNCIGGWTQKLKQICFSKSEPENLAV